MSLSSGNLSKIMKKKTNQHHDSTTKKSKFGSIIPKVFFLVHIKSPNSTAYGICSISLLLALLHRLSSTNTAYE